MSKLVFFLSTISATILSFAPLLAQSPLVAVDTALVGDAGNIADTNSSGSFGAVSYEYRIGKYEVTINQYAAFLNSVATNTTNEHILNLWNNGMAVDPVIAGIARSGSGTAANPYSYTVIENGSRPIAYVSWFDAARFCNWLHNGATNGASTESGTYALNGATNGIFLRTSEAKWWIPSEDEWYKAAYYKGGGTNSGYWTYPTRSDSLPGNSIGASPNQANIFTGTFAVTGSASYNGSVNYLTDVGAFTGSASAYGTFDQGGNLWEYNDAVIGGSSRGGRGGGWYIDEALPQSSFRDVKSPTEEFSGYGFRVAGLASNPRTIFVDSTATGAGDGSSWSDAYTDLQSALAAADAGTQIWVAEGTYKPSATGDRSASFVLKSGVSLYGGFAGTENSLAQRDIAANQTILSGDLEGNDSGEPSFGNASRSDNSKHILTADGLAEAAALDGFVIQGGHTDSRNLSVASDNAGGGLFVSGSKLTIRNCVFSNNYSVTSASLWDSGGSDITLDRCLFIANRSERGASVHLANVFLVKDSGFVGNRTQDSPTGYMWGGGLFISEGAGTVVNTIFHGNFAGEDGGAVYTHGDTAFINCTFVGNESATTGTAVMDRQKEAVFQNCIFWGNIGGQGLVGWPGSGLVIASANPYGGPASIGLGGPAKNSIVQGGYAAPGSVNIITEDPMFYSATNPLGADGVLGTSDDGLRVMAWSPALEAGDNSFVPADITADIAGASRIVGTVDLGAYEGAKVLDPAGDEDGDGVTNYREGRDGTDPSNPNSFEPLSVNLLAHYTFDNTWNDSSGYDRHALAPDTTFGAGLRGVGSSLSLTNGNSQANYWSDPDNTNTPNRITTFSLSIWMRPSSLTQANDTWNYLFSAPNNAAFLRFGNSSLGDPGSKVLAMGYEWPGLPGYSFTTDPINRLRANNWQQVVGVQEGSSTKIYLNGRLVGASTNGSIPFDPWNYTIGNLFNTDTYQGLLDEARIYGRTLSATEIRELYSSEARDMDSDGDGLADVRETATGQFVSAEDTGSDPYEFDSSGDGISDGEAINGNLNPLVDQRPVLDLLRETVESDAGRFGFVTQEQNQQENNTSRTNGRADVIANPAAYGLYTADSIMDLRMGGVMIQKLGSNAVVTFQPQTTADLTQPFTNNGTPITNQIPMPGNKGFIRIRVNSGPTP